MEVLEAKEEIRMKTQKKNYDQHHGVRNLDELDPEWPQEHYSEFRHFRWPPKSPDMNIIEHIWDALQDKAIQWEWQFGFSFRAK
ncbi:unnamed protein product [Larinioides sclopetarius]|uniref:Tc1-like transposase DDE domain-containing protein n=1 Tax=Larinioides sclopetarius TaxID=280406 RepID=A0AAV1ZU40_9ARAC